MRLPLSRKDAFSELNRSWCEEWVSLAAPVVSEGGASSSVEPLSPADDNGWVPQGAYETAAAEASWHSNVVVDIFWCGYKQLDNKYRRCGVVRFLCPWYAATLEEAQLSQTVDKFVCWKARSSSARKEEHYAARGSCCRLLRSPHL